MLTFFYEGGLGFMSVLTVLLVAIFFAAWKAPRWVKEIGLFALLFGFLGTILGLYQVLIALRDIAGTEGAGSSIGSLIPPGVLCGGLKVTLNTAIYGICIYLVSLVVRVIQKPRL
jgi:heme A synthase